MGLCVCETDRQMDRQPGGGGQSEKASLPLPPRPVPRLPHVSLPDTSIFPLLFSLIKKIYAQESKLLLLVWAPRAQSSGTNTSHLGLLSSLSLCLCISLPPLPPPGPPPICLALEPSLPPFSSSSLCQFLVFLGIGLPLAPTLTAPHQHCQISHPSFSEPAWVRGHQHPPRPKVRLGSQTPSSPPLP